MSANTDREIWRRVPGDYYSPSLHVTQEGAIGINVGGHVVVAPVEALHSSLCVSPGFDGEIPNRRSFEDELVCLLNKYSKENGSNTPDFILADYLIKCLETWNVIIAAREDWYGRKHLPGRIDSTGGVACKPSEIAIEIAARVWCDQEMGNCVMDVEAAEAIAKIIDGVRHEQSLKQSMSDLAASGGIGDAS